MMCAAAFGSGPGDSTRVRLRDLVVKHPVLDLSSHQLLVCLRVCNETNQRMHESYLGTSDKLAFAEILAPEPILGQPQVATHLLQLLRDAFQFLRCTHEVFEFSGRLVRVVFERLDVDAVRVKVFLEPLEARVVLRCTIDEVHHILEHARVRKCGNTGQQSVDGRFGFAHDVWNVGVDVAGIQLVLLVGLFEESSGVCLGRGIGQRRRRCAGLLVYIKQTVLGE